RGARTVGSRPTGDGWSSSPDQIGRALAGAIGWAAVLMAGQCATYTESMSDRAGATGGSALPGILAIFVLSRLVLLTVALLVEANIPMQPGGSASTAPILRSLTSSDGPWYLSIAASGYHAEALRGPFHDYVFFPLWPLVIRIASVFSGANLAVAAVVAANAAFGLALVVFERLSRPILGASGTLTAAAFLAFAPGAVAFAMAYTRSEEHT